MAKLIFRSNYFKNESATHKKNYMKYLGTREGVEMNPDLMPRFFYEDLDMHGKKENYIDYISGRPRVEKPMGQQHGLFSYPGYDINLEQTMDQVANHKGTVWINVISLTREDAERLGYNHVEAWQNLLNRNMTHVAKAFKIDQENLIWFAAFHNEGHHPHVHMVVMSKNPKEGFINKKSIEGLKSTLVNDIFREELRYLYTDKSQQRSYVKEQAKESLFFSIGKISEANPENEELILRMRELGEQLRTLSGKKVYGYLPKNMKEKVDEIVSVIARIPQVKEAYEKWIEYQKEVDRYYSLHKQRNIPLERNKEFRSIANLVIRESIKLASDTEKRVDSKNVFTGDTRTKNVNVMAVTSLLNGIERVFNESIIDNPKHIPMPHKDKKQAQKEREKKIAHGQKADDTEMTISM